MYIKFNSEFGIVFCLNKNGNYRLFGKQTMEDYTKAKKQFSHEKI